jgi:hypothetical protein
MLDMLMMMLLCIRSLCCAALLQSSQTHFRRNISQQTSPRANRFPPETGMCRPFTRPSSDMLTVRVRCARLRKVEATAGILPVACLQGMNRAIGRSIRARSSYQLFGHLSELHLYDIVNRPLPDSPTKYCICSRFAM